MTSKFALLALMATTLAVAPACATKKFVRTSVGDVNAKVDSTGKALEATQARVKDNEAKIGSVDAKAEAAGKSASDANAAAMAAANAAKDAATKATAVDGRVADVEKASRRLLLEVTLSEEQGKFDIGKAVLPDATKARIDEVIGKLKADPKNVYIEVEGHTDDRGDAVYNQALGLERAEAVKRYIYEQHQVPLHRISVISYGEDKPVAPNKTREGRAQNRRVVIRILA